MNKKGSLFHISKRDTLPLPKALLIRGGILVLALVFCGLITTLLTGQDPITVYRTILKGAFGSPRRIGVTFRNVAVLLGISLAVTRSRCASGTSAPRVRPSSAASPPPPA